MKNLIIVLFTFMTCNFAMAQYGFLYTESNPYKEWTTKAFEDIYGDYIISTLYKDNNNLSVCKLFKFSSNGSIIKTKKIPNIAIQDFIQTNQGIIGVGISFLSEEEEQLYFCRMTNELEILFDTTYSIEYEKILYTKIKQNKHNNNYTMLFSHYNTVPFHPYSYMYELTFDGIIVQKKYISDLIFDFLIKPDGSGYYIFGLCDTTNSIPISMMEIDNSFNIISIDSLRPELNNKIRMHYLSTAKWFNDNTFLYAANKSYSNPNDDDYRNIAITRINKHTRKAIYEFETGMGGDTIDYCASINTMDFIDSNKIYFAGVNNMVIVHPYDTYYPTWISIFQLDSTLNVQWQLQIGGDANYELRDVMATCDGGCLLMINRFDPDIQIREHDLYIFKVNADGSYNAINMPPEVASRIVVFPNPGSNAMHIRFTDNKPDRTLLMFDMSGKQVLQTPLSDTENTISTERLPQGMYIYHLQENNKTIQSGKWIKQ